MSRTRAWAVLVLLLLFGCAGSPQGAMRLYFLNVGQGDAVLVVSPEGRTLLYDGGPKKGGAVARLRELGVRTLDLVVSSHGDADHIAAQEDAVRAFGAANYMDNGLDKGTNTQRELLEAVRDAGARLLEPTQRTIELGSVKLLVVPPPPKGTFDEDENNLHSIGVSVRFGNFRAWLSGDSEEPETRYWLSRYGAGGAYADTDVYKSIHHGSENGDNAAWLAAVKPKLAVISVGKANRYGHPDPAVLRLYQRLGLPLLHTDRDGEVLVTVQPDGRYTMKPERGEALEGRAGAVFKVPAP